MCSLPNGGKAVPTKHDGYCLGHAVLDQLKLYESTPQWETAKALISECCLRLTDFDKERLLNEYGISQQQLYREVYDLVKSASYNASIMDLIPAIILPDLLGRTIIIFTGAIETPGHAASESHVYHPSKIVSLLEPIMLHLSDEHYQGVDGRPKVSHCQK